MDEVPRTDELALRRPWLSAAFVVMMGSRILGAAVSPLLVAHVPLALLALSPVLAHLVLVAGMSSAWSYWAVALPLCTAHCLLGYALGRVEGPRAVRWLVARGITTEGRVRRLLTPLRWSAPLLVLAIPGPVVCTLAGASSARARTFVPALTLAQILWVGLCRFFGEALLVWIAALRLEIARHALPLTLATALVAAWFHFRKKSRARNSG